MTIIFDDKGAFVALIRGDVPALYNDGRFIRVTAADETEALNLLLAHWPRPATPSVTACAVG